MKKTTTRSATKTASGAKAPSQRAHAGTEQPADWRPQTLAHIRTLIQQAAPDAVEEVKWRKPSNGMKGVPVWSHGGILCTGETYKDVVKLTFAKGASLPDPSRLFNASLEGNTRRAIDLRQTDKLDEAAFKALIKSAVALNTSSLPTPRPRATTRPRHGDKK